MQVLSFAVVFVCKVNVSFDSVYTTSPSHRDDDNNDDNDREIVFTRYESLSFAKDKFKFYAKRIRNCGRERFRLLFITCENASLAVRFRTCNSLSLSFCLAQVCTADLPQLPPTSPSPSAPAQSDNITHGV